MNDIADILRRIENLIRHGSIAEVDPEAARCRVQAGGLLTDWLPFYVRRAGSTSEWDPVSVGEQCTLLCPSGDPALGAVLVGLYSAANPPHSTDPAVHRIDWANGDYLEHNAETGALTINCSGPVKIIGSRIDLNE